MDHAAHDATIATLREQGYEISDTMMYPDGRFRIGIRSHDAQAWVELGDELRDLAAGRLTLVEIAESAEGEAGAGEGGVEMSVISDVLRDIAGLRQLLTRAASDLQYADQAVYRDTAKSKLRQAEDLLRRIESDLKNLPRDSR